MTDHTNRKQNQRSIVIVREQVDLLDRIEIGKQFQFKKKLVQTITKTNDDGRVQRSRTVRPVEQIKANLIRTKNDILKRSQCDE